MNAVTVTTDQLMMSMLVLIGMYVLSYNRKWIWRVKKILFHVALVIVAGFCTGELLRNIYQRKAKITQQARIEQQEARRDQLQRIREMREPVTLAECEDAKQIHLPGEWWQLYQSLLATNYYESMLSGIESFTVLYPIEDVEPLPMAGLDLICKKAATTNRSQSHRHIARARKALNPYLSPFNEAPVCFVKEKKKCSDS